MNAGRRFVVLGLLGTIASGAFGLFVLLFFAFYMSAGMPALRRWVASRMKPSLQVPFLAAWDLTRIKVGGYIAARIVLASINTVYTWDLRCRQELLRRKSQV